MSPSEILIVEDESIVALDLEARLVRMGYQVVGIAFSGEEAIRLAAQNRPTLVLMDIRLRGGMDGVETAAQIRARYGIPVAYLTAYADEPTLQRAKVTEPLGYLVKPFEERDLRSTIEMALYRIEMERSAKIHVTRLEQVVSTVPDGVVLLDAQFRILLTNAKARICLADLDATTVDGSLVSIGGVPIKDLRSNPRDATWHEISLSGTIPRTFETILTPTVSHTAELSLQSKEWVLVIREVTRERQMQLRAAVQDRLAAVGQFAAGIAHDFNNILASIMLSPYVIMRYEPNLSPRAKERLGVIADEAKRASNLISQILDFSRASEMETHAVDLRPLLKELSKMLERVLPDNITLKFVYGDDSYVVEGDPTRLHQLMMNLIVNARDAMPEGGVVAVELTRLSRSEVSLECKSEASEWIRISVSDTGTGISPDNLSHIFEPFFTTKPIGRGTGLGLAQVYGIVQQHEGCIDVDSLLGRGTTFSVYLPSSQQFSSLEGPLGSAQADLAPGRQQTVLLVEDSETVRESLCQVLELLNYRVLTAANGREALAITEQPTAKVDLVVSDLSMPSMGGVEMCRELRRRKNPASVLIFTGYASDETRAELEALGVTNVIAKPVQISQLVSAVERALSESLSS